MNTRPQLPTDTRQSGLTTPLRLLLATTAAFWMGTAQPQGTTPVTARAVTELRFRDFYRSPVGSAGLEISEALRKADGQTVRLIGYMVQQEDPPTGRFMLAARPVQMSEHADGQADDLPPATVLVQLDPEQQTWAVPHVRGLVSVSGVLHVGRYEGEDARVSWVRLQLGPDAARAMDAGALTGFLHRPQRRN